MVENNKEVFIKSWFDLKKKANKLGFETATFMKRVLTELVEGNTTEFRIFVRQSLLEEDVTGMLGLARAVDSIPSKDVWERIGTRGIRFAMRLNGAARDKFIADAIKRVGKHGIVCESVMTQVEGRHAPISEVHLKLSDSVHPAHERDVLRMEFFRIIKKYPQIERDLSPEARSLLGFEHKQATG